MPNDNRAYVGGKFALELAGRTAGWLYSVEGGNATSDVMVENDAATNVKHRHIGNVNYEPISFTCGMAISKSLQKWMLSSFHHVDGSEKDGHIRHENGSVIVADFNYKERLRQNFWGAVLTEVTFPGVDASSTEPAKFSVKMQPEKVELKQGKGEPLISETHPTKQKRWLLRNFKFGVDGFNLVNVNKVEALTFKQNVKPFPIGEEREATHMPTSVDFPNLTFTLPEANAWDLVAWHNDFVIKGNCTKENEKKAHLTFFHEDMKTEVCRLEFDGIGIFGLTLDKSEAFSDSIRRVKIDCYTTDIKIKFADAGFGMSFGDKLLQTA